MTPTCSRLLVVDDCDLVRSALRQLLHEQGFPCVDEAGDGLSAFALFKRTPYDVIITDWTMPYVSGLELLRAIRTNPERPGTAVLLITGDVTPEREAEAMAAGATGFVGKPFVVAELMARVEQVVATLRPQHPSEAAS